MILPVTLLPHVGIADAVIGVAAAPVLLIVSLALLALLAPERRPSKPPS